MPQGMVTRAVGGFFDVTDGPSTRLCRARGVFRKRGTTVLVGDRVLYEPLGDTEGVITAVMDRDTQLVRPPVANVTQAILVFSLVSPAIQTALLDRLLVAVATAGLKPMIVFSKCDLVDDDIINETAEPYASAGYSVVRLSSRENFGVDDLRHQLTGEVSVFAGPSGAGKSTLANALAPELGLKMGEISDKVGRGKHTTRHVELFRLDDVTWIVDAPGFSQLDLQMAPEEVRLYFPEFQLLEPCPYRGCLHSEENDCSVKAALETGRVAHSRYENYVAMVQELKVKGERKH